MRGPSGHRDAVRPGARAGGPGQVALGRDRFRPRAGGSRGGADRAGRREPWPARQPGVLDRSRGGRVASWSAPRGDSRGWSDSLRVERVAPPFADAAYAVFPAGDSVWVGTPRGVFLAVPGPGGPGAARGPGLRQPPGRRSSASRRWATRWWRSPATSSSGAIRGRRRGPSAPTSPALLGRLRRFAPDGPGLLGRGRRGRRLRPARARRRSVRCARATFPAPSTISRWIATTSGWRPTRTGALPPRRHPAVTRPRRGQTLRARARTRVRSHPGDRPRAGRPRARPGRRLRAAARRRRSSRVSAPT